MLIAHGHHRMTRWTRLGFGSSFCGNYLVVKNVEMSKKKTSSVRVCAGTHRFLLQGKDTVSKNCCSRKAVKSNCKKIRNVPLEIDPPTSVTDLVFL